MLSDHKSDSSIPTDISHPVSASSQPGFEELATGFPSTVYPWGASPAHEVSDIAQVALPLVQAFTGVIPLVGAPMSAATGGLLQILQVIDVSAYRTMRMFLDFKGHYRDAIRTRQP
jgi:hypothetical protein